MNLTLYDRLNDEDKIFYNILVTKGLILNDVQVLTIFPYTEKYFNNTTANVIKTLKHIIQNNIESSTLYFRQTDNLTYVYPSSDACEYEYNSYFVDNAPIKSVLKNFEDAIALYFSDELSLLIASPFKIYINNIGINHE